MLLDKDILIKDTQINLFVSRETPLEAKVSKFHEKHTFSK